MFCDFYGFGGRPFQLTPDAEYFFQSATHRKALSYLGYGLSQGEGFVVVTGEAGTGKSTLAAHLARTIDPRQLTVAQAVCGTSDEQEIARAAARGFGLDVEGQGQAPVLGALEGFLHGEASAGRRCLLIVDEAQHLSIAALEQLRLLSNFQLGNRALLQILLLGQPGLRATLGRHPLLEQRVIAADYLAPMEQDEIEPYVVHRLERAGWSGQPQFERQVFAQLFLASDGIPSSVNQIANRLLLLGAVEERERIDSAMLRTVLDEMEAETIAPPAKPTKAGCELEGLLASRDAEIAELREQLARLEDKTFEHERTFRHTLTMLIDWIEGKGETEQNRAA